MLQPRLKMPIRNEENGLVEQVLDWGPVSNAARDAIVTKQRVMDFADKMIQRISEFDNAPPCASLKAQLGAALVKNFQSILVEWHNRFIAELNRKIEQESPHE